LAFPMAENDDLDDNMSDDQKQDDFLAGMMHVASKPDPSLMKKYRLPVMNMPFSVEEENPELENLSSDESIKHGESEQDD